MPAGKVEICRSCCCPHLAPQVPPTSHQSIQSSKPEEGKSSMPIQTKYLFFASMDVTPEKEALFNEVYDQEHVPQLLQVPGVISVTRLVSQPLTLSMGGKQQEIVAEGEPKYTAIYEIEGPEVLVSDAWAEAVEIGRWPEEVRPYTSNRRHVLRKVTE
jgi:hypothetical protein